MGAREGEQRIISLQLTGLGERRQFNQSRKCHKIRVGDEVSGIGGLDDNERESEDSLSATQHVNPSALLPGVVQLINSRFYLAFLWPANNCNQLRLHHRERETSRDCTWPA